MVFVLTSAETHVLEDSKDVNDRKAVCTIGCR